MLFKLLQGIDGLFTGNNNFKGEELMKNSTYKIMNVIENNNIFTITYICNNDPIPYSLFQCSFAVEENHYSVYELLHFCMKAEDFLDIHGLYSSEFEQMIMSSLHQQIPNYIS
jgi:hypothetical protein